MKETNKKLSAEEKILMEEELKSLLTKIDDRKKNYSILDTKIDRIPKQKELFNDFKKRLLLPINERARFYLYYGGNGGGKCHAFNDKILGYDSKWKLAGEIKVGDVLMGPDSLPRTVDRIAGGRGEMYEITPESGEPIHVNGDHQLLLIHRRRSKKGDRPKLQDEYSHLSNIIPEGKIVQMSVNDYLKQSTKWKAEAYIWRPSIINYDRKLLSVDPYFLGVWLGDGSTTSPSVTNIDKEIIDYVYEYAESIGLEVRKYDITYSLKKKGKRNRFGFSGYSHLREIGVLGNKHIPIDYLTSSEEQRLALLAGLIDTDGEVGQKDSTPRYSITQKSERLARDIMQLARSLGFRSNIVETIKTCTNHTRKDYTPGTYYRVTINGDVWRIPVKIERKKFIKKPRRNNKDWRVSKFLIEPIGVDDFYGFSLDGDHLYLDENFIVQHNTAIGTYITSLLAIGGDCEKYGLPYIGTKKNIWVGTKSGSNVKGVIHPYFLGEGSMSQIPKELIEKTNMDNGILKSIIMRNGCKIQFITYDQGSENLQGGNPDWILLDEEPVNEDVWSELKARTRNPKCEMLITMTPLNGLTKIYSFFFEQKDESLMSACKTYKVSSLDNPYTDKTWTKGMSEEEYRLRVEGSFENPTGLVYNEFFRTRNVVPHFEPRLMALGYDNVKYYRGIDFGTSHPTACVWVAQDADDNFYVFDEFEEANMLLSDIVDKINQKSSGYDFEYTIRDSAAKREGIEIQRLGIRTVPADKHSKGANDMSNRRSGILIMNELFSKGKLLISNRCQKLIRELETHYYKDGGKKDGEVNKEGDDLLDALRYTLYMVRKNNSINKKSILIRDVENQYASHSGLRTL